MNFFQAIILGIIQGITEWLPISSSGHLVLAEKILGVEQSIEFSVALHLASLIVVLFVFRKEILEIIKGFFRGEKEKLEYVLKLFLASIPIGVVGYFLSDFIKVLFTDLKTVGFGLIFTSVILFLSRYPKEKTGKIDYLTSIMMGISQAFAILPGISRSGLTISSGMIMGKERKNVAVFAFLMFIPAIIGAGLYEAQNIIKITNISALIVGAIVAFIVGVISLKLLIKIIENNKFIYFSIYCLVVGLIILGTIYL